MKYTLSIAAILMLAGDAWAEPISLVCDYSGATESPGAYASDVPREIDIDVETSRVTLNDDGVPAAAQITDRWIRFRRNGFHYSISRTTGQIRFSNPSELERWAEYRSNMVSVFVAQGKSPAQGHADVDQRLRSEFTAQEHVGSCSPASTPKF